MMEGRPDWDMSELLLGYLQQLPFLLVYLAGMILALVHWQRYPKVALLTFLGTALLFFQAVAGTFLEHVLLREIFVGAGNHAQVMTMQFILRVVRSFVIAGAWVMILFAIFGWREQRRHQPYYAEESPSESGSRAGDSREGYPPTAYRE
jgi:hypothetical protein